MNVTGRTPPGQSPAALARHRPSLQPVTLVWQSTRKTLMFANAEPTLTPLLTWNENVSRPTNAELGVYRTLAVGSWYGTFVIGFASSSTRTPFGGSEVIV